MSITTSPPPNCGRRLIPTLIDDLATHDPERVLFSIPRTTSIEDGFEDITISVLARAINNCAWWIERTLQRSENFETLNYVGPQDLRYVILLLAGIKTGYQVCLNSRSQSSCLLQNSYSSALPSTAQKAISRFSNLSTVVKYWFQRPYHLLSQQSYPKNH